MKILQFGRHYPPHTGGTETVIYDLANGLNEKGVKCDVLCCNDYNRYEETNAAGFTIYRTKSWITLASTAISPQQIFKLRKIAPSYDLIHIHHPAPMATLALRMVNPSVKVVLSWHSDIVKQATLLKFYKPLQNWLLKKADSIVATSPAYIEGSESLTRYPFKTTNVPLGIQTPKAADANQINQLRAKYGNKKIVFSLGRLVEYKGFEYLIEAAKMVHDDTLILIGGQGHLKEKLTSLIASNGVEHKVKLLGKLSDQEVLGHFEICDLFCLPSISKNEAFGIVIIEAMAKAKPVLATNIPESGVSWVNQHDVTGLNVPILSSADLAKGINEITSNAERAKQMGMSAKQRFDKLFTRESMVNSYLEIYKNVLTK